MPADASIYGLIRPQPEVAFVPPEERQLRQVRLRQLLGDEEMRRMQIDEARRGVETNRRIQDLFSTNPNATPDQLAPIDYKAAEALRKARLEEEAKRANIGKDKASSEKDQFQVAIDKLKYGASILSNAKDQQSYDMVVRMMANTFGPNSIEKFPAQFDPLFVKTAIDRGITRQQQLEDERARATAAETGRHNIETEQTARGNLAVSQGTLANARERLQFEKEQPKGVYDPERGVIVDPRTATSRPVLAAGGAPVGAKLPESSKKELASIDAQANTIDSAIKSVQATPSAFSFTRGLATMAGAVPETIAGRADSTAEREARSFVFNVVSKVINERAGAAQSAQELARLRSFLPAESDNARQIEDKLSAFKTYLGEQRKAYETAPTAGPRPNQRSPQESGGKIGAPPARGKFLGFE